MAPLTDEDRLRAYKDALSNWSYEGYVRFELTETAHKWLRTEFDSVTLQDLARRLWEHVNSGGEIDEVRERLPSGPTNTSFTTIYVSQFRANPSTSKRVCIIDRPSSPMNLQFLS